MEICYNCFQKLNNNINICPHCGYNPKDNRREYPLALPNGTVLAGKYILGRVLGQGGFGITYIAYDYNTKEVVAIKEYFPDTVAIRSNSLNVASYSGQRQESFDYGKECFLNEARTLAEFIGNPNIVRVYSYFEENNTAYFAMEYIKGISLQRYIMNNGGRISYEAAKTILFPIMDALSAVHSKGIIHRDISPDNIFITDNGAVKLLDFGAARYSMGDRSRSLDVVLKHGFAPKEQYTRRGRQGPYTDVYSLAATFYRAITGRIPPDSIDRLDADELILPSVLGTDIPSQAEDALLKALAVHSIDRYQNINEFKKALQGASVDYVGVINKTYQSNNFQHINNTSRPIGNVQQIVTPPQTEKAVLQSAASSQKTENVLNVKTPIRKPKNTKIDNKKADRRELKNKEHLKEQVQSDEKPVEKNAEGNEQKFLPKKEQGKPFIKEVKKQKENKSRKSEVNEKKSANEQIKVEDKPIGNNTDEKKHKSAAEKKQSKPFFEKVKGEKKKTKSSFDKTEKTGVSDLERKSDLEKNSKPTPSDKKRIIIAVSSLCAVILLGIVIVGIVISSPKGDWEYSISDGQVTIDKYLGSDADVKIPSEIDGASVTTIGESAFYECDTLCSVKIPNSVNMIEEWAFYGCDKLTDVILPDNATIKNYAFFSCKKINGMSIPEGCKLDTNVFGENT